MSYPSRPWCSSSCPRVLSWPLALDHRRLQNQGHPHFRLAGYQFRGSYDHLLGFDHVLERLTKLPETFYYRRFITKSNSKDTHEHRDGRNVEGTVWGKRPRAFMPFSGTRPQPRNSEEPWPLGVLRRFHYIDKLD